MPENGKELIPSVPKSDRLVVGRRSVYQSTKFGSNPSISFWDILVTDRQTYSGYRITSATSLTNVMKVYYDLSNHVTVDDSEWS